MMIGPNIDDDDDDDDDDKFDGKFCSRYSKRMEIERIACPGVALY